MMNRETTQRMREYYDSTSTAAEMTDGAWEEDTDPDPMVTTSLRLPKSLLDWVRAQADAEHVKPTALMRRWIEERRDGTPTTVSSRLERLERAVFAQRESSG